MKRLLYIFLILFLFSCSTVRRIDIEVLMPPVLSFPESGGRVVVLNNSPYLELGPEPSDPMKALSEDDISILDTIINVNLLDGFFSIIDESPFEQLHLMPYFEIRSRNGTEKPEPLSVDAVVDFCTTNDAGALISLEYINLNLDYTFQNVFSFSAGPYIASNLKVNRKVLWRVYDNSGFILDEFFQNDTLYWSHSAYDENEAYRGLPGATQAIRAAFYAAGQDFGKRLSPYWQNVSRVYYSLRKPGVGDISMDREQLLLMSDHRNRKKSYKACFNLALLSEKDDDLRSALRWLEIAEFKNPDSPYAAKYKERISERIATREKIRQSF